MHVPLFFMHQKNDKREEEGERGGDLVQGRGATDTGGLREASGADERCGGWC